MCGIIGCFANKPADIPGLTYLGLYALQHRGQESAGIAVSDGRRISISKGMGLVTQALDDAALANLQGHISVGHTRYSTAGSPHPMNMQPLSGYTQHGQFVIAHNGNLVNAATLREKLQAQGSVFQTTTDSEVILNLIARHPEMPLEEAVAKAMGELEGAYSVILITLDRLIAFRDPAGVRPLSIGQIDGITVIASETAALDTISAEFVREVNPGELVVVDSDGIRSTQVRQVKRPAFCVFEYVYVARPDSSLNGSNVHLVRKQIGRILAREAQIPADLVIPAPESANSAAMGYAEEAGLPFDFGLMKNRYVGRTFIQPTQAMRSQSVRMKFNAVRALLEGKRVILVDDSIVRGTTTAKTVQMLRDAGAREVHMAIAAPPFTHPCHYGIDVPTEGELIASNRTPEEVRRLIGADSLHYISLAGLCEAVNIAEEHLCLACFNGIYPVGIPAEAGKHSAFAAI